jgi:hypothetical protein
LRSKTQKGERVVSLDAETVKALRQHRVEQHKERLSAYGAWEDGDLVFCREDGTAIPPQQCHQALPGADR